MGIDLTQKAGLEYLDPKTGRPEVVQLVLDTDRLGLDFRAGDVDGPGGRHSLSERTIQAIRKVCRELECEGPTILYRMYRDMGVGARGYRELAQYMGCRYDISVFGCGTLGEEWFKTSGHYHPPVLEAPGISYPEVYEVVCGKCLFLLQSLESAGDVLKPPSEAPVKDVILLEVHKGERAVMPPNYGHVMINHRPDSVVVTSNWVSSRFSSLYGPYELCQGGAYYVLRDGDGLRVEPNRRYGKLPECVRLGRPKQDLPGLGLDPDTPLFKSFYARPDRWQYVSRPDKSEFPLTPAEQVIEIVGTLKPGQRHEPDC